MYSSIVLCGCSLFLHLNAFHSACCNVGAVSCEAPGGLGVCTAPTAMSHLPPWSSSAWLLGLFVIVWLLQRSTREMWTELHSSDFAAWPFAFRSVWRTFVFQNVLGKVLNWNMSTRTSAICECVLCDTSYSVKEYVPAAAASCEVSCTPMQSKLTLYAFETVWTC